MLIENLVEISEKSLVDKQNKYRWRKKMYISELYLDELGRKTAVGLGVGIGTGINTAVGAGVGALAGRAIHKSKIRDLENDLDDLRAKKASPALIKRKQEEIKKAKEQLSIKTKKGAAVGAGAGVGVSAYRGFKNRKLIKRLATGK